MSRHFPASPSSSSSIIRTKRRAFLCVLGGAVATLTLDWSSVAQALFKRSNENQTASIDHNLWGQILKTYVRPGRDGINRVDYAGVKRTGSRRLNGYLSQLAKVPVSNYSRDEQFAYWVNLYNALTLKVVVDAYPVDSIKSIGGLLGFGGPWKKKRFQVEGQNVSLDDIEHNILRANWKNPLIHYGVNCASIGCPNLQQEAFTAENKDRLLNKGAAEYVNSNRGAWVRNERLYVSSIYSWFDEDFGGNDQGIIRHLGTYASPGKRQILSRFRRVSGDDYDWSLNNIRIS